MHELSVDSEVTLRKVMGSAEMLPTRPSVDPNEVTRPMDETWSGSASTPSDWSGLQLTTVSPSVITSTSYHTQTPTALHNYDKLTRSSAVAERPRDDSCLSVVSFNIKIPRAQSFIIQ